MRARDRYNVDSTRAGHRKNPMLYNFDMGYGEFAKRPELCRSLAYSLAVGLCGSRSDWLLCDFTDNAKKYAASEILSASIALARRLRNLGVRGRAAVAMAPSFTAFATNYACIFAGIIPVNINFTLGPVAAKSCFNTAGISTTITSEFFRSKISKANPMFPWSETVLDAEELLAGIPAEELRRISDSIKLGAGEFAKLHGIGENGSESAEATLVFTSGSEGMPKAAILTERNIIANCLQTKSIELFSESDILLANLPIFHSFGLLFEAWYMAIHGQKTVTLHSPLDIKNNIRAVREMGVTAIIGSPTFFRAYIKHASAEDMKTVRMAIAGAEKTPQGFHELWNSAFGDTYREGYGLTEASPVVGVNMPERDFGYFSTGTRKGSIGKLFPGMRAKILRPGTLAELPFGQQGLLALKGPNVFAGYLGNESATNDALKDGWLVTGDLSRLDADGFLYIDGRISRFSKIGGEMVPHATVEAALNAELKLSDSAIPMVAVSSRLDEGKGEALVLLTATDITLAQAKDALRKAGISNLWQPKYIVRVDAIPLLPSGKLDLKKMSELAS